MPETVASHIQNARRKGKKKLAVLIDPDQCRGDFLEKVCDSVERAEVDMIFVGGSLLSNYQLDQVIGEIKQRTGARLVLFPGNAFQVSAKADALLFLSLISGRNPELLIGQQVMAAPLVKQSDVEVLPTGYMLIDGGRPTTASYISGSLPIPADKPQIAALTALAGSYLGLQYIYMDAGSGAQAPITTEMIKAVREQVDLPMIVGGGIRDVETAVSMAEAGADVIVVGNATERNPLIIEEIARSLHKVKV
ncbi:MAG: geranylgeranylglyceryl/heptaprenylglyceryl phosphate synthase [Bacteroidota bacterium]|nr:geranylgeranylglyceryl/heptaprenylglyceryl phosphate synthase [Bacteroidota bacterium]